MWLEKMCFMSWNEFKEEFMLAFCPENEATTVLMWLKSNHYFQGKQIMEAYIDVFKDLVDLSDYTNPIVIVVKLCKGLNLIIQDRIAKSGTDRPQDMDFNGWFKAAQYLDLNRLANEAYHYASRYPPTHSVPTLMMHYIPLHTPFSFLHSHAPPTAATPVAMYAPLHALPPGIPMDINRTQTLKPIMQTCYHCGQTAHISRQCNLCHDVCHMTLDEQDEFIQL
jgi:hypothetical protein